jgi:threonine/homoserine/homoserine lactone efflux protein
MLTSYLLASLICIAAPGSDSLGTLSIGLAQGRSRAVAFAAGVGAGCLTHTLWAALGVAAIVQSSPALFSTLKIAGALYLVYLGVITIANAATVFNNGNKMLSNNAAPSHYFWRGFISNAMNPKVMLFFLAFLPQFVDPSLATAVWVQMLGMGVGFAGMTASAYIILGWVSGTASQWITQHPTVLTWINRTAGMVFLGLAARLLFSERR